MTVPTQGELHRPLLEIAAESDKVLPVKHMLDAITNRLSLTQEDLEERTSTGAFRTQTNVYFAVSLLKRAGLLQKPARAQFRVTSAGRDFLKAHEGPIRIGTLNALIAKQPSEGDLASTGGDSVAQTEDDAAPVDKIDSGYRALQEQLSDDLLDSISRVSPGAFERLVVDLLEKMGYGRGDAVGRSRDDGIDGIMNQDALGLEKVYMQAKRWQSQVGEPEIRNFSGSLDAKGATKGVFVTTSSFSSSARRTAETISAGNKFIRLIDGHELARLMLDHDVGVITTYTYKIQALDENYFADEL